jgi:hypothetical protein
VATQGHYLQLRRPHEAVTELTGALDALDPALRKHRCTALADLATALIVLGEVEEGCRRAGQALGLAIDLRHAVSVDRVRDLDQRLNRWGCCSGAVNESVTSPKRAG